MGSSPVNMFLEVSVDNWVHSATYNVNFGCGHKDRPLDKPAGVPVIMELNISDVAAGMSDVKMRLHWLHSAPYYWAIDDFTLSEAYNNDVKISYVKMEWDDNDPNTNVSWIYNIPKSQLTGYNGNSVFHRMSPKKDFSVLVVDTIKIADKYSPVNYGHYQFTVLCSM